MKRETTAPISADDYEKIAFRVSGNSIAANCLLAAFKLFAGIFAHSGAMLSDAVHSASDVCSTIIVMIGVRMAAKDSDEEHPYGHERFECVAAIILAVILCITGVFIGHTAIENLSNPAQELQGPGMLALIAAIVSIAVKEGMYWYTRYFALRLDSSALMANAWHHRSDALSSVGALVGIAGARMGYRWLDAAASLVICVFIIKAAYDIFMDAIKKMVDHACSPEMRQGLEQCAKEQPGVMGVSRILTRQFGNKVYVDMEILADGSMTLSESHAIAEKVHETVEKRYPSVKHILVRVNPGT